jgi:hypothetical protein
MLNLDDGIDWFPGRGIVVDVGSFLMRFGIVVLDDGRSSSIYTAAR